jgi:glycerol-3-phosphate dehydrogenase (NAD(P)+)
VAGLASVNAEVRLVCRTAEQATALSAERIDRRYLPGVRLPDNVRLTHLGDSDALLGCALVALAIPSKARGPISEWLAPRLDAGAGVLSLTKGLDPNTGQRLGQAWMELLGPDHPLCVLTGPNHAEEVAAGQPTAAVVAGDPGLGERVQTLLNSSRFRVYWNDDLVGVELAAAAKNVVAVAAGMSDGLGLGDNAKASLITRGLAEMTRLGEACGGRAATFRGLAGMGDLVATCTSRHSRNRRAGELIAQGTPAAEVEERLGQVVEGLVTVRNLLGLAADHGVELPISTEVARAAFEGRPVDECVASLMMRVPAAEN